MDTSPMTLLRKWLDVGHRPMCNLVKNPACFEVVGFDAVGITVSVEHGPDQRLQVLEIVPWGRVACIFMTHGTTL